MKKLTGLFLAIITGLFVQVSACANHIDKTISQSGINRGSISVSVKDVTSGKSVYKLNDKQPKNPASTLKLITYSASVDTLGNDYEFKTELYKSTNNDLYLKLSGNPFLTRKDLKKLFNTAKDKKVFEPKNIYIDDFVMDDVIWGEGWQWDDDLNPLMPKFSSYNLDGNMLEIVVSPTREGSPAEIRTTEFYPVTFMNMVTTGDYTEIDIARNNSISPDILNISGTIARKTVKKIPLNNPKRYFVLRCEDIIRELKLGYYGKYLQKKIPQTNIYLVDSHKTSVSDIASAILKESNNMAAETLFKVAGGKFVNNTGSLSNSQKMLSTYLDKIGVTSDDIRVADGSGVSKNNLLTSDFMTDFLIKRYEDCEFVNSLAMPGEGTLKTRMLYFKDNLHAKTGTLSDISAIAGYITALSGKTYAFDIMINDPKSKPQEKKSLEEYILREIYSKY